MLKIGFEIHQQLDTHKLFCSCPSVLREEPPHALITRKLRPTQSELGEIDRAAMDEFLKGKLFVYETYFDSNCLVELDEEPPHEPNEEAVDAAIEVALLLDAEIVDEMHFMRKLVIDGSNTSGFQRTAIVALNGVLETSGGKIGIPTICLEEEAARKTSEDGNKTTYRLDRLGIPLVEIATAPDIKTPAQAREAALKIGELLRATGKVKRGIGTIRQDINVSIEGGARVEIKGVQDLNQIPKIIENEVERQKMLIAIASAKVSRSCLHNSVKEELKKRRKNLKFEIFDVSEAFKDCGSKVIAAKLRESGAIAKQERKSRAPACAVLALKLNGFKGLLGKKLGQEFAQYAAAAAGVKGIFHSDELPAYGISKSEVDAVSKKVVLGESDAFVLVAERKDVAEKALDAVFRRAMLAFDGVVEETRAANQDATTSYMRPLPEAARMYPETDIPPMAITAERIKRIKENLPELFEDKIKRYTEKYGLSRELASQVVKSERAEFFEDVLKETKVPPSVVANALVGTITALRRDGFDVGKIEKERLMQIFKMVSSGAMAKEAIADALKAAAKPIDEAVRKAGQNAKPIDEAVRRILQERESFVREKGESAAKPIMGLVMKDLRGKVDGKLVNEIVQREIKKFLGK